MTRRSLVSTLILSFLATQAPAEAAPPAIASMGAYVATDDMGRATEFYTRLFDTKPKIALDAFVAFNVAGGWFAVVSRGRYAPDSKPGTGAVPYIQSGDLEAIHARAVALQGDSVPAILEEPGIRILKLTDPDGHLIEFFQFAG